MITQGFPMRLIQSHVQKVLVTSPVIRIELLRL
jgi:hypothetical protein